MTTSLNSLPNKYHAFISYRHADNKEQGRQWATWLHQAIETYDVPKELAGNTNLRGEIIPTRIYPVFRDEQELPAHADLGQSIVGALEQTNLLVVLCSPRAATSTYVADEINYFKKLGRSDNIIAVMIDGEPNTSWDKSKIKLGFSVDDECFPIPLQFEYGQDGMPTEKHAEPIAADFRINNDGVPEQGWTTSEAYRQYLKENGLIDSKSIDKKVIAYQQQQHLMLLKIIAGILGVSLGELTLRDKEYQLAQEQLKAKRLRRWLVAVTILTIIALGSGGVGFLQWRQATQARNQSENILNKVLENLSFMKFDLRDVLTKYTPTDIQVDMLENIDTLSIAVQKYGDNNSSNQRALARAYISEANIILKNQDSEPQKALLLLNKARHILEGLAIDNPTVVGIHLDLSLLYAKLGDVILRLDNTKQALSHYQRGVATAQTLIKLTPTNKALLLNLSRLYNKLANFQLRIGNTKQALVNYQADLSVTETLSNTFALNTKFQHNLSLSHIKVADAELRLGNTKQALIHYQTSLSIIQKQTRFSPDNMTFWEDESNLQNKIIRLHIRLGNIEQALVHYQTDRKIISMLMILTAGNIQNLSANSLNLTKFMLRLLETKATLNHYRAGATKTSINPTKEAEEAEEARGELWGWWRFPSLEESILQLTHVQAESGYYILASDMVMFAIKLRWKNIDNKEIFTAKTTRDKKHYYHYCNLWSWYMLHTNKINELPEILGNIFGDLPEQGNDIAIIQSNLAHAYLLSGNYDMAKAIYKKHINVKFTYSYNVKSIKALFSKGNTWEEAIISDFNALLKYGIASTDFERITNEVFGKSLKIKSEIETKEPSL